MNSGVQNRCKSRHSHVNLDLQVIDIEINIFHLFTLIGKSNLSNFVVKGNKFKSPYARYLEIQFELKANKIISN